MLGGGSWKAPQTRRGLETFRGHRQPHEDVAAFVPLNDYANSHLKEPEDLSVASRYAEIGGAVGPSGIGVNAVEPLVHSLGLRLQAFAAGEFAGG